MPRREVIGVTDPSSTDASSTDASSTDASSSESRPAELVAQIHRLIDELAATGVSSCTDEDVVAVSAETERASRRLAAVTDQQVVEISDRDLPRRMRSRGVIGFLAQHLGIGDPVRRHRLIKATARFHGATGEVLEPQHPRLADALAAGGVAPARAHTVLDILEKIPYAVAHDVRVAAEAMMAEFAIEFGPAHLSVLGSRLMAHLDPDGQLSDDSDRARRRNLWLNRQDSQLMSKLTGHLDPQTRAMLEVLFDTWGAAGVNNRDDENSPSGSAADVDPQELDDAAKRDLRSTAQRHHDALHALLAAALNQKLLGKSHRGMPTQVIIKVDEKDLRRQAGLGTTASGTELPISDVIKLAARSQQYLAVFSEHTSVPLYFGRSRRLASLGQRLASFAADGGEMCSAPGCTQPATHVEIHHTVEWAEGGLTDIDVLAPACPVHHHMIGPNPGQYSTRVIKSGPDTGRTAWRVNAEPGMPLNPEQVNRFPDARTELARHLSVVRSEIHQEASPPTAPAQSDAPIPPDPPLPPPSPPRSGLEDHLTHQVLTQLRERPRAWDITWPRYRSDPDDPSADPPSAA